MFELVRVGSRRVWHARLARELIPAFVGAGHAPPAFNDFEICSMGGKKGNARPKRATLRIELQSVQGQRLCHHW